MDQGLPYYAGTLWGNGEEKLPLIFIQRTKCQSASMTNKSNPTFIKLVTPLLTPTGEKSWKNLKKRHNTKEDGTNTQQ